MDATIKTSSTTCGQILRNHYYRELLRNNFLRLALTYLAPLILLTVYFYFQYGNITRESQILHLQSTAEHQANALDLFLRERLVNLSNLIDDPKLRFPPSSATMEVMLDRLKMNSDTFIDVGFFDATGVQVAYEGPVPALEKRNYSHEAWFVSLKNSEDNFIITDIYLGFRQKPHFTIAVSRRIRGEYYVLRATLDPEKFYDCIRSLEAATDVYISIVNREGYYQLVTPHVGTLLESSAIIPPHEPRLGTRKIRLEDTQLMYSYA